MKYGAKPRSTAGEVGSIAHENREALHERGLKLKAIQDSAERMGDDAEDFASLATKLAERERKKNVFGFWD